MKPENSRKVLSEITILGLLLLLLIPLEIICAKAAFETLGEIDSGLYWIMTIVGNCIAILVAIRSRIVAATVAILLGLVIVPYQMILIQRHFRVQTEAARIVTFVYESKIKNGEYPENLANYVFQHPELRMFIQGYYTGSQHGGFQVVYRIGTESTSHWYSPKDGWSYYPD